VRVDAAAKVAVLAAFREGRRLEEVADAFGVTTQAFYAARRRDKLFDAGWRAAHAAAAEAERRLARNGDAEPAAGGGEGEERIVPNNRRLLQRRKLRHVRFDEKRRALFLSHFRWSCDALAAAAEAGVCERTVYNHLRADPQFAEEYQAALAQGYLRLEAEALRQRLEAQKRLRAAMDAADAGTAPLPAGDVAAEFERVMKLLARWDRRHGPPGRRTVQPSAERAWTFDEAIVALDKRLRALGLRSADPPPEPLDEV
jgi:hypothetical protein